MTTCCPWLSRWVPCNRPLHSSLMARDPWTSMQTSKLTKMCRISSPSSWIRDGRRNWWQGWHLPSTNVARDRFPHPVSYVDWVCWFSTLLWEVFPLSSKNQHLIWFVNNDCKNNDLGNVDLISSRIVSKEMRHDRHKLLVSYQKPHRLVSKNPVSRWLKHKLKLAGIDTSTFGAHSSRAASTSAAKAQKLSITTIMDSAGWSSENTFVKYYNKTISKPIDNFGNQLLHALQT